MESLKLFWSGLAGLSLMLGTVSAASATLVGDSVGACVVNYPDCVTSPTPGVNEGGTLNTAVATIGSSVEFNFLSATGNTRLTADFDAERLTLGAFAAAFIPVGTTRTDLGWVFTGIDTPIQSVFHLGGNLAIRDFFWTADTIGVNLEPFSGLTSRSAEFQITFVPEPSTAALLGMGLVTLAGARPRRRLF